LVAVLIATTCVNVGDAGFELSHVDEFIDLLLTEDRVCDIILPRITVSLGSVREGVFVRFVRECSWGVVHTTETCGDSVPTRGKTKTDIKANAHV
jgi:hypothetical protein